MDGNAEKETLPLSARHLFLILIVAAPILVVAFVVIVHVRVLLVAVAATKVKVVVAALGPKVGVLVVLGRRCGVKGLGHNKTGGYRLARALDRGAGLGVVVVAVVAVQDAGVDVGGRVDLGVIEEEEDGAEHALGALEGGPALAGLLARHAVFAGGVEDRDAEAAVGVDVGVGDRDEEAELGRGVGVVVGKDHLGAEVAAVEGAVRVDDHEREPPLEEIGRVVLGWATRLVYSLGDKSGGEAGRGGLPTYILKVDPVLLAESLQLGHEPSLGPGRHGGAGHGGQL